MVNLIESFRNKIVVGHNIDIMKTMPSNSIDMCIYSPPYYGLRFYKTNFQIWGGDTNCDHEWSFYTQKGQTGGTSSKLMLKRKKRLKAYNIRNFQIFENTNPAFCDLCGAWYGELGNEPTFNQFIDHLILVNKEIKRILKPHGTLWVNLGDTYWGGGQAQGHKADTKNLGGKTLERGNLTKPVARGKEYKNKCLCLVPERFRTAMVDDLGYIIRNKIIWYKPDGMPSSVPDRLTVKTEDLDFFTKDDPYFFDLDSIRVPLKESSIKREQYTKAAKSGKLVGKTDYSYNTSVGLYSNPRGANPSNVSEALRMTHEVLNFFVKQRTYFFDLDAIRVKSKTYEQDKRCQSNGDIQYNGKSSGTSRFIKSKENKSPVNIVENKFSIDENVFPETRRPQQDSVDWYTGKYKKKIPDIPYIPDSELIGLTVNEIIEKHGLDPNENCPICNKSWKKHVSRDKSTIAEKENISTAKRIFIPCSPKGKNPSNVFKDFWSAPQSSIRDKSKKGRMGNLGTRKLALLKKQVAHYKKRIKDNQILTTEQKKRAFGLLAEAIKKMKKGVIQRFEIILKDQKIPSRLKSRREEIEKKGSTIVYTYKMKQADNVIVDNEEILSTLKIRVQKKEKYYSNLIDTNNRLTADEKIEAKLQLQKACQKMLLQEIIDFRMSFRGDKQTAKGGVEIKEKKGFYVMYVKDTKQPDNVIDNRRKGIDNNYKKIKKKEKLVRNRIHNHKKLTKEQKTRALLGLNHIVGQQLTGKLLDYDIVFIDDQKTFGGETGRQKELQKHGYYFLMRYNKKNPSNVELPLNIVEYTYNHPYVNFLIENLQFFFNELNTVITKGIDPGTFWKISTEPFSGRHFALFPQKLIINPIKAGCPKFVCSRCGQPKEWECNCGAGFKRGIVLDPFFGAGTTALVAKKLGRDYIGIELNSDYAKIAKNRIELDLEASSNDLRSLLE